MGVCDLYSSTHCNFYEITQEWKCEQNEPTGFFNLPLNFMKNIISFQLPSPINSIRIMGVSCLEVKLSIWGRGIYLNNTLYSRSIQHYWIGWGPALLRYGHKAAKMLKMYTGALFCLCNFPKEVSRICR